MNRQLAMLAVLGIVAYVLMSSIYTVSEVEQMIRITSYNVCYTKLLRGRSFPSLSALTEIVIGKSIYHQCTVRNSFHVSDPFRLATLVGHRGASVMTQKISYSPCS